MVWIWMALSAIVFVYIFQELLGPKNGKRGPPGPRGIPIFGHFHLLGKNPHRDLFHLARKYGPIMGLRFGFGPTVIISSPSAAELVLKTHDPVFANRPRNEVAIFIGYNQRDIAFGPYGPYWRYMRKVCTLHLLSSYKIAQFEPMRRAELGLMVKSLKRAAVNGEAIDLSDRVFELNGDMTFLIVFGRKYSDFEDEGIQDMIMETMQCLGKFNLADYFPYVGVLDLQGLRRRAKRVSRTFDAILEKIIDDHLRDKEKRVPDIVDAMMEIMESGEAGFDFDRRHVKAVLLDMIIGGMDTSSTSIDWAMSELMRHPTLMKKLQQELKLVVGLDKMVEESHLHKLEYLDCVVKEVLRLHPVTPLVLKESIEDCELERFHIPKKSRIIMNIWAVGRDPNFWPDPESFIPERFIGNNTDLRGRHFELIPFGSGRRICPGLQLGLMVVKLVVAQLVHCFDWELPDGINPCELDMGEHYGLVTSRAKHLMAIPKYRLRIN